MSEENVKICNLCKATMSMQEIVHNPDIRPIGMAFADDTVKGAYYFFQHEIPTCGTSFVLRVENLKAYIVEPTPSEVLAGTECCEHHCVNLEDLGECKQSCHNAPFRRFLLKMLSLKKVAAELAANAASKSDA